MINSILGDSPLLIIHDGKRISRQTADSIHQKEGKRLKYTTMSGEEAYKTFGPGGIKGAIIMKVKKYKTQTLHRNRRNQRVTESGLITAVFTRNKRPGRKRQSKKATGRKNMFEGGYISLKRNASSPPFVFPLYRQIYEAKTPIKEITAPTVPK